MNVQFVGNLAEQILGTFHPALSRSRSMGVILAPPIGTEYLRTHWVFRRLASQLTRAGFPVMRFDYRGIGDSSGDISEIHSLTTWCEDIWVAAHSLRKQSGCKRLAIVGLRLGAAIAIQAAQDIEEVEQVVAWEPVLDGDAYLDSLRQMQRLMLDLWAERVQAVRTPTHEEILGSLYSRRLLEEIATIRLDEANMVGLRYDIVTPKAGTDVPDNESARWDDLRYLELAWLPNRCLKQIVENLEKTAATY